SAAVTGHSASAGIPSPHASSPSRSSSSTDTRSTPGIEDTASLPAGSCTNTGQIRSLVVNTCSRTRRRENPSRRSRRGRIESLLMGPFYAAATKPASPPAPPTTPIAPDDAALPPPQAKPRRGREAFSRKKRRRKPPPGGVRGTWSEKASRPRRGQSAHGAANQRINLDRDQQQARRKPQWPVDAGQSVPRGSARMARSRERAFRPQECTP